MTGLTTDGRSARARAKRQARRAQMLGAAERLFREHGYHGTSVADVIDAAGVSRGTFYLYFDSKESLFLTLIDEFVQRVTEVVEVVDPAAPEPTGQIYANIRRVVDVVFDHRDLTILVLREAIGVDAKVDEKLHRLYGFLHEMVCGALVNGAAWGLVRRVDERVVAMALIGAAKEVFYQHLVLEPPAQPDREAVTRALFDFGLRGLLPTP